MQPAFLRIIDNIRKRLEESSWKGTYQDVLIWPEGTTEETQATVVQLRQQLQDASPETVDELEQALTQLPTPYPGYRLCLQHENQQFSVDMWELCYRVCFRNYDPTLAESSLQDVEIDTSLIDETGEVDWERLEVKARQTIEQVFTNLPAV